MKTAETVKDELENNRKIHPSNVPSIREIQHIQTPSGYRDISELRQQYAKRAVKWFLDFALEYSAEWDDVFDMNVECVKKNDQDFDRRWDQWIRVKVVIPLEVAAQLNNQWLEDIVRYFDEHRIKRMKNTGSMEISHATHDCHTTRAAIWELADKDGFSKKINCVHRDKVVHLIDLIEAMWR